MTDLKHLMTTAVLAGAVTLAQGASFDCALAASKFAKAICADPELSDLDSLNGMATFKDDQATIDQLTAAQLIYDSVQESSLADGVRAPGFSAA